MNYNKVLEGGGGTRCIFWTSLAVFLKKKMPIFNKNGQNSFFGRFINKISQKLRKMAIFGIFSRNLAIFSRKFFALRRKFLPGGEDRGGGFSSFFQEGGHEVNKDIATGGTKF